MTAPTDPLSLGDGFDNKGLAPAAASLRHRAASPSGLRAYGSSLSGIDWRGILHCWLGPMITLGVLLIFIFGIGRHWHG